MKENVLEYLNSNNIAFEEVTHQPVFTMEDMVKVGLPEKCDICKNLFLRDSKGKSHYLVTALNETDIDLKRLGEKLGTKLSFASEKRVNKYLDSFSGCISPFGILGDEGKAVTVILDNKLKGKEKLGLHPNENTATLIISCKDLEKFLELRGNEWYFMKL